MGYKNSIPFSINLTIRQIILSAEGKGAFSEILTSRDLIAYYTV